MLSSLILFPVFVLFPHTHYWFHLLEYLADASQKHYKGSDIVIFGSDCEIHYLAQDSNGQHDDEGGSGDSNEKASFWRAILKSVGKDGLANVTRQTKVIINCIEKPDVAHTLIQGTCHPRNTFLVIMKACLLTKTHYVDFLVDPAHISSTIATFDGEAREKKIKIIPGCGAIEVVSSP